MKKNSTLRILAAMLCLVTCLMAASCDLVDRVLGKDGEETTTEPSAETTTFAEETTEGTKEPQSTEPTVADTIGHGDAMGDDDFMTVEWGNTQE